MLTQGFCTGVRRRALVRSISCLLARSAVMRNGLFHSQLKYNLEKEYIQHNDYFTTFVLNAKKLTSDMDNLNRIKAILAETNHTGKWLAEQLGKDTATVSKWCTNRSQPDIPTLAEIAIILNVDMRELLTKGKHANQEKEDYHGAE